MCLAKQDKLEGAPPPLPHLQTPSRQTLPTWQSEGDSQEVASVHHPQWPWKVLPPTSTEHASPTTAPTQAAEIFGPRSLMLRGARGVSWPQLNVAQS